jgi:hypothetical protein
MFKSSSFENIITYCGQKSKSSTTTTTTITTKQTNKQTQTHTKPTETSMLEIYTYLLYSLT